MISGENAVFTLVRCDGDEGWLEQRRRGIGGSDVAAIMGLSPWRSPLDVWMEKTGRAEPQDLSDRPYIQFGNIMEPVIADWYRSNRSGLKVRRVNAICQSMERPWAQASLDYEVHDPELGWGVLEIKTARNRCDWADGVPAHYLTQIIHYMNVTGRIFADVAVFFRDEAEFESYRYAWDDEDDAAVEQAVDTFWNDYVLTDTMPALVGTQGETVALAEMFAEPAPDSISVSDPDITKLISEYQTFSEIEKGARTDKQKVANELMRRIGDHKALITDTSRVTWVRSECERFDQRRFRAEHPDLYAQYTSNYMRNGGIRVTDI